MTPMTTPGQAARDRSRVSADWIFDRLAEQTEVETAHRATTPEEYARFALFIVPGTAHAMTETSPGSIEASWRQSRQLLEGARMRAAKGHRAAYGAQLATATAHNARRGVLELLSELSGVYGLAWADIASMLGVSVPALRKWRKAGGGISPDNHRKLATLTGFFGLLAGLLASPAPWMSMRLVEGFNVTPTDVYSPDSAPALLDLASGNAGVSPESVLDGIDSGWREHWRSMYETFQAGDGELSMRPRQD